MKKGILAKGCAALMLSAVVLLNSCASASSAGGVTNLTDAVEARTVSYDANERPGGVGAFSFELFKQVMQEENAVISPLSAYLALAMTMNGADGVTLSEFESLLGGSNEYINETSKALIEAVTNTDGSSIFTVANSAWVDTDATIYESFLEDIVTWYGAEAMSADLNTDAARKAVNEWISEKTEGLIPEFRKENYNEAAVLALINTVYLKMKWADNFPERDTRDAEFYIDGGETVSIPFMNQETLYDYVTDGKTEGVVMPYDDGKTAFAALLPQEGTDVRDFAAVLTAESFSSYLDGAENQRVYLSMPKFTVEFGISMNDALINMGLASAFEFGRADFTRMGEDPRGPLYISEVNQKVKIIVDEEGTEAAAVTEVAIGAGSAPVQEEPIRLILDRPFVYMVYDIDSGIPLFMGIMDNPQ